MSQIEGVIWCDNCGVEIIWAPVVKTYTKPQQAQTAFPSTGVMPPTRPDAPSKLPYQYHYCCQECFQGLLCRCGDRMEIEDDRRQSTPNYY